MTFVGHANRDGLRLDLRLDQDPLPGIAGVAVEHRVGQRLGDADPELEGDALAVESRLAAPREEVVDGALDRPQIVGQLQYDIGAHGILHWARSSGR